LLEEGYIFTIYSNGLKRKNNLPNL